MGSFEFMPHTADIALRVRGSDFADLLRTAALGLVAAIAEKEDLPPHRAPNASTRHLEGDSAPDEEGLLVNFLNEVIYQSTVRHELYSDFEITGWSVEEGVHAEGYVDPGLTPERSVKAATYYDLAVKHTYEGIEATIVFDV